MKRVNLIGQRFGKLIVISLVGKNKWGNLKFLCKCDCGGQKVIPSGHLRQGNTQSCGCMSSTKTIGLRSITHGFRHNSFYNRYIGAKMRCNNPNNHKYSIYGKRGIKFLWNSFEEFRDDMYESYLEHIKQFGKDTSIDRIDVNGNYCKENCRWATAKEQSLNTRKNTMFHKGQIPWNKKLIKV